MWEGIVTCFNPAKWAIYSPMKSNFNSYLRLRAMVAASTLTSLLFLSLSSSAENNTPATTNQPSAVDADAGAKFAAIKAAAETGDAKAIFDLARAYERGTGVEKDAGKAAEYARIAANKGYAPAQVLLGSYCGKGFGQPANVVEAIDWYRKAADQGYPLAEYAMG